MNEDIAISVKNVSKNFKLPHEKADSIKSLFVNPFNKSRNKFEVQHALRNISFDIPKGEFFGIVGRNGSGKSTLLKIIAGIYQPNKGSISVNGKLVPFIELGVGFNPQLTGRENVYLNGALLGFSEKEVDKKYDSIVDFAEIERFMDQKLKNYSSGMQVRLAFSVATILAESDILLIDEVLAVGDADFQRKCFEYFKKLKKHKKTVVFVSHDMSAVREFCDRAILIESSEIIAEGSVDTVASQYSRLFLDIDEETRSNQSSERWGDQRASFRRVKITSGKVLNDSSQTIIFEAEIIANKDIDSLVTGSSITTATGEELCGTNTQHRKVKIEHIKKGEVMKIVWEYPNIFSDGRYTINVTLHGPNGGVVAEWWEGAESFVVRREEKSPFPTTPDIKLQLIRKVS